MTDAVPEFLWDLCAERGVHPLALVERGEDAALVVLADGHGVVVGGGANHAEREEYGFKTLTENECNTSNRFPSFH